MQHKKDNKIVLISCELFGLIPLWTVMTDYSETIYKILGIPVWKVKDIRGENRFIYKTRYYFLGLPIIELSDEIDDEDCTENFGDEEDY